MLPLMVAAAAAAMSVGVASARHISYYDDDDALRPILTRAQERRVCTELCMSGLGGPPCGDGCLDLTPRGLPIQSLSGNRTDRADAEDGGGARRDVCPRLCEDGLGEPLCGCDPDRSRPFSVNFLQICSAFCVGHDYQLFGCPRCELFEQTEDGATDNPRSDFKLAGLKKKRRMVDWTKVDWNAWCVAKCRIGEGGAACNCDLLPMAFK